MGSKSQNLNEREREIKIPLMAPNNESNKACPIVSTLSHLVDLKEWSSSSQSYIILPQKTPIGDWGKEFQIFILNPESKNVAFLHKRDNPTLTWLGKKDLETKSDNTQAAVPS